MSRKVLMAVVGAAVLVVLVGPALVLNVFRTSRAKIQQQTRGLGLVDPQVELDSALREATGRLPEDLARLRMHLGEVQQELQSQARAQGEYRNGLRLMEADLKRLAAAVHANRGCELRGRKLDAPQAHAEAARLLERQKTYQGLIESRERLAGQLRDKRAALLRAVSDAETAMADVRARGGQLAAKIAVLKASQRIGAIRDTTSSAPGAVLGSLAELDRDVERRLLVEEGKQAITGQADTPDPYLQAVRQSGVEEELKRLYPPVGEQSK